MGLIIKDKISQLRKGYPTVSDKYNVQGGVAMTNISFGDLVAYGETTGHYVKYTGAENQAIAGIAIATNVKLIPTWPAGNTTEAEYEANGWMGLLVDGFIAVELAAADVTLAKITEGSEVKVTAAGKFATSDKTGTALPDTIFTGVYEAKYNGTTLVSVLAEIRYNM